MRSKAQRPESDPIASGRNSGATMAMTMPAAACSAQFKRRPVIFPNSARMPPENCQTLAAAKGEVPSTVSHQDHSSMGSLRQAALRSNSKRGEGFICFMYLLDHLGPALLLRLRSFKCRRYRIRGQSRAGVASPHKATPLAA